MKGTEISKRISLFMKEKDLTQKELAKTTGYTQSVISEMMNGKRNVLPLAERISKHYDIELWKLTGENEKPKSGIPYYDVDFIGGFDIILNNQTSKPDGFINIGMYNKATCLCNITGHSMEPEISNGDIIILRKIDDWHFLPYGEVYAFVTKNDMRTVKRIGPAKNDNAYILYASNKSPEYAPQELLKEDILQVFEVMGSLKKL